MISRITLLSCLIFLSVNLFAQQEEQKHFGKMPIRNTSNNNSNARIKNSMVLNSIYVQDFAQGLPVDWVVTDSAGEGKIWKYTTTGPLNYPEDSLKSTTAANGYMLMDDDSYGQGLAPAMTEMITSAINCTGQTSVKVRFQEFFRYYLPAGSEAVFLVSNDSINWVDLYHAETGLASNAGTPNANTVEFDITAIAANQPTVYLNFTYRGDWGFFWEIDDIEVFEPAPVNAAVTAPAIPINGCQLSSVTPISVNVLNVGVDPISGIPVSYTINGGTAVNDTVTDTIAGGASLLYTYTQTADLSAPNQYNIAFQCNLLNDADPVNDTASTTTTSYASISVQTAPYTMGFEPGEDFSGWIAEDVDSDGVTFDISSTFTHTGVGCLRKPGTVNTFPEDNWIYTTCFDFVAGSTYALEFWYKNFELATPCQLSAYLATQNNAASSTQNIVMCPIPADTTYQYSVSAFTVPANGSYYIGFHFYTTTPVATSMRIDDVVVSIVTGIEDKNKTNEYAVYPNPSNGLVTIKGMANKGSVTVLNQMGQVVLVKSFSSLNNAFLDLSDQPVGIYHVQISTNNTVSNQTINISR